LGKHVCRKGRVKADTYRRQEKKSTSWYWDVVADRELGQVAIASMYRPRRKKDQDECDCVT
jgi:hypothetical protein